MSCVYEIRNLQSDTIYIGSTKNFERRKKQHLYYLNNNQHTNSYLQNAWNKYGEKNFKFMILEETTEEEQFNSEQDCIDKYLATDKALYNLCVDVHNPSKRPKAVKFCSYWRKDLGGCCNKEFETVYANQKYCTECMAMRQEWFDNLPFEQAKEKDESDLVNWQTQILMSMYLNHDEGDLCLCDDCVSIKLLR